MKSIRYIMYFVLMSMTMSLLAQENAQAVAQGENKIDEKVERNTIRKGNGLFNDKKYTEAEIEYRKALEANPSSEIATYNLGAALYKQQKWNDSRNEYRKIVQASSDSLRAAHAWHNLGNISFQEKNYAQSIGLTFDETATECWDNPISANTNNKNIGADIESRLNRYKNVDGFTSVWIWAEKVSDTQYELYIGYA